MRSPRGWAAASSSCGSPSRGSPSKASRFCAGGDCRAIVDTGTSLLGVPSDLGVLPAELLRHAPTPGDGCGGPGPGFEADLGNVTVQLGPEDFSRPGIKAGEEEGRRGRAGRQAGPC